MANDHSRAMLDERAEQGGKVCALCVIHYVMHYVIHHVMHYVMHDLMHDVMHYLMHYISSMQCTI